MPDDDSSAADRGKGRDAIPSTSMPATAVVTRGQDNRRGIAWMIAGMFLFSLVDAQSKYLSQDLPLLQISWARHFGIFVVVAAALLPRGGLTVLRTSRLPLQILRGALTVTSSVLFLVAISYVELADAVAISFVGPLALTAMSAVILGEPAGMRRWLAIVVGFGGAMIVLRPGLGVLHPAAFLVLGAASLFGLFQVLARLLSDTDDTRTTLFYTAIVGAVVLTIAVPFVWEWPQTLPQAAMLCMLGVLGAGAEFALIKAIRAAPGAVIAPFQYTMLLWGTTLGFVLFDDLPDQFTLYGAAVLIAAGLYTYYCDGMRRPVAATCRPEPIDR